MARTSPENVRSNKVCPTRSCETPRFVCFIASESIKRVIYMYLVIHQAGKTVTHALRLLTLVHPTS